MRANRRSGEKWTKAEESKLIELSNEGKGVVAIAHKLGRSKSAVITKRAQLEEQIDVKYRKRREQQQLSEEQKDRAVTLYRDELYSINEIADIIKTTSHFVRKALKERDVKVDRRRVRIRIDRETLQKAIDSGGYTLNSLAKHFGTSYGTILNNIAAQKIDITHLKKTNREEWTTKEIERLKELVESNMLFWEIGQELNRSAISCRTKAYAIGLSVRRDYDLGGKRFYREDGTRVLFWTEEESKELERLYSSGYLIAEIAKRLGRSYASVQKKLSYMGLFEKYEAERQELYKYKFEQIAKGEMNNG